MVQKFSLMLIEGIGVLIEGSENYAKYTPVWRLWKKSLWLEFKLLL